MLLQAMLAISRKAELVPHVVNALELDCSEADHCIAVTHMMSMYTSFDLCGVPITECTMGTLLYGACAVAGYLISSGA